MFFSHWVMIFFDLLVEGRFVLFVSNQEFFLVDDPGPLSDLLENQETVVWVSGSTGRQIYSAAGIR